MGAPPGTTKAASSVRRAAAVSHIPAALMRGNAM
jgi:hypothetical protein